MPAAFARSMPYASGRDATTFTTSTGRPFAASSRMAWKFVPLPESSTPIFNFSDTRQPFIKRRPTSPAIRTMQPVYVQAAKQAPALGKRHQVFKPGKEEGSRRAPEQRRRLPCYHGPITHKRSRLRRNHRKGSYAERGDPR